MARWRCSGIGGRAQFISTFCDLSVSTVLFSVLDIHAVLAAVEGGKITLEEACRRYQLTEEDFRAWHAPMTPMVCAACARPACSRTALRHPLARGGRAADCPFGLFTTAGRGDAGVPRVFRAAVNRA